MLYRAIVLATHSVGTVIIAVISRGGIYRRRAVRMYVSWCLKVEGGNLPCGATASPPVVVRIVDGGDSDSQP